MTGLCVRVGHGRSQELIISPPLVVWYGMVVYGPQVDRGTGPGVEIGASMGATP